MSRGGIGPNIAYTMALLGERPRLMGTVGQDFGDFRAWLEAQGIDTSLVIAYPGEFTATFTVITDLEQNQIAGFHAGAMSHGRDLTYRGLDLSADRLYHHLAARSRGDAAQLRRVPRAGDQVHLRPQPAACPLRRRAGVGRAWPARTPWPSTTTSWKS